MIPTKSMRRHLAGAFVLAVAALAPALSGAQQPATPETAPPATSAPATDTPQPSGPASLGSAPNADPAAPASSAPAPTTPAPAAPAPAAPAPAALEPPATAPAAQAPTVAPEPAAPGPVSPSAPAPFAADEPDAIGVETGDVAGTAMAHDLSPWGMFMAADWVVKGVMIGLVFASFVTWTIWLAKALELGLAKRRARAQVNRIERAGSLRGAIEDGRRPLKRGPVAALALTAASESELSGRLPADGVKERVAVALQRIEARSGRRMARGTGLLATIGSTAPFVGLFGTVWGIMNSFIGIAETNTTNLAVVAPGIAEALLATGIGLVAAIPAVIIYNVFARSIAGYRAILADGSAAVMRHLSRDLDRRDAGQAAPFAHPAE